MLNMLFLCLELLVNSGSVTLLSRLARHEYKRRGGFSKAFAAEIWTVSGGTIRLEKKDENSSFGPNEPSDEKRF